MIRSLKAMGVVLGALLAMGVVFASSASAQFESESAPVTLTVASNEMQKFAPTAGGTAVECTTMSLDNSTQSSTATTTLEVFPTYSNCENFIGLSTAVNMNGCGYLFHTQDAVGAPTTAKVDVKCPAGKKIEISIGGGFCLYTLEQSAANTGLAHVVFTNGGTGTTRDVTVHATVEGITSTRVNNGFGCPAAGSTGTYTGTATITGENSSGQHVPIFMS